MEIVKVIGREILDSRGNPTVEADVYLADGSIGRAAVPPALPPASMKPWNCATATNRAISGKGTRKAVANIANAISPRRWSAWMLPIRPRSIE